MLNHQDDLKAVADRFVSARRAGTGLDDYPGSLPATLDEAYAIQAHGIALRGGAVAGWKIGRIAAAEAERLGAERLVGPIFADLVTAYDGQPVKMAVIDAGFAAAEAEFLLELGELPDPLPAHWTIAEAKAVVRRVAVGIEIASSPLRTINDLGPAVTISDFGNNNGLLVGADLPDWRDADLDALTVRLSIDGDQVGEATTATMLDGPYGAVRFLLETAARRNLPVRAGQWVSTGAVTGVHRIAAGSVAVASFGEQSVAAEIVGHQGTGSHVDAAA